MPPCIVFRILGALEVDVDGALVEIGAEQLQRLLCVLLLDPGRVVSNESLLVALWPEEGTAPRDPAAVLRTYASRLRKLLPEGAGPKAEGHGYRLEMRGATVDASQFEKLVAATAVPRADNASQVALTLREALGLWRGAAVAEFRDEPWAAGGAVRLEELRLGTLERLSDARLLLGEHVELCGDLERLVDEYPLRERLWAQLMTAQYRSGRQGEALRTYRRLREQLIEDLGIEPSPELAELEGAVLRHDPALSWDPRAAVSSADTLARTHLPRAHPVRYTTSQGVTIAYQVVGEGDVDLVCALGIVTHLEVNWEEPSFARFLTGLASFSRLILFDKRGVGLSDRVEDGAALEERMDDIRAVMDATGSAQAVVFGVSEGACASALFAATFPERTKSLILYGAGPLCPGDLDDPTLPTSLAINPEDEHTWREYYEHVRTTWGYEPFYLAELAPSKVGDAAYTNWWMRWIRQASSPASFIALEQANRQIDIRPVLPSIGVPALVLHRRDEAVPVANGRYLAAHIPGASYVELSGRDHIPWVGDVGSVLEAIEEFATGVRHGHESDRVLTTLLFTDIVSSTARSAALGDRSWRDLLEAHYGGIRRQLTRWRGHEVKTTGDGCLATFDGPARALQCACAIRDDARAIGLEIRAGIHTGEVELVGDDVAGLAVHLCQRVQSLAVPGEVLASSTVKDLVAGSGIRFDDRGRHELRGVPGEWQLYAAVA